MATLESWLCSSISSENSTYTQALPQKTMNIKSRVGGIPHLGMGTECHQNSKSKYTLWLVSFHHRLMLPTPLVTVSPIGDP